MLVRGTVLCAILITYAAPIAWADPPATPEAIARSHFEEGSKLFNLGEFSKAGEEYKLAYKAKPDPIFLYNIAQCYRLANDLSQALFFYRSFLRNKPNTPNRHEVEERIKHIETLQRQNEAPPNAPLPPERGARPPEPEASAPARPTPAPETTKPVPPPSEPTPETSAPPPAPAPAASESATNNTLTARPPEKKTPIYKKWWLWTAVGAVVVVGVAVGVGVGVSSGKGPTAPASHFGTTPLF